MERPPSHALECETLVQPTASTGCGCSSANEFPSRPNAVKGYGLIDWAREKLHGGDGSMTIEAGLFC